MKSLRVCAACRVWKRACRQVRCIIIYNLLLRTVYAVWRKLNIWIMHGFEVQTCWALRFNGFIVKLAKKKQEISHAPALEIIWIGTRHPDELAQKSIGLARRKHMKLLIFARANYTQSNKVVIGYFFARSRPYMLIDAGHAIKRIICFTDATGAP